MHMLKSVMFNFLFFCLRIKCEEQVQVRGAAAIAFAVDSALNQAKTRLVNNNKKLALAVNQIKSSAINNRNNNYNNNNNYSYCNGNQVGVNVAAFAVGGRRLNVCLCVCLLRSCDQDQGFLQLL